MSTPRRKAPAKPPKQNNPYGIDPKVWSKIVGRKKPTIERVMFAAALDPLLIHELDDIQPPRSFVECVQLADMGTRGDIRSFLKGVLMQWVMSNRSLVGVMARDIAFWDNRLAVWCAAACVESILRFVPENDDRPRLAVEAAKNWVFGIEDSASTLAASRSAYDASAYAASRVSYDAPAYYYVCRAAADVAYAASAVPGNVSYFINATVSRVALVSDSVRDTIARAIESYPVEQS